LGGGIINFKNGYQPRTNTAKNEKDDLVTDSHSTVSRWRNHFSQLLDVHGVNHDRRTEIHTAELLVPEPSASDVEMAVKKLKRYKSPGTDQILAELIKAGDRTIRYEIHKLISIWNMVELPDEWKESIIVPIYKKSDKEDCSNYRDIITIANYVQNFIHLVTVNSLCRGNNWESSRWILMQQVNYYSAFVKYLRKMGIQRSSASALYRRQESL